MKKVILRILAGISVATLVLGAPPAYAIFGIRIARKAIAARRAAKAIPSSSSEDAAAQERARFTGTTGYSERVNSTTESGVPAALQDKAPS